MPSSFPTNTLIAELDPLIISSPTIRAGTTLLQRLLCSSGKALIYGELCAQDLEFFVNLYTFKAREYSYHKPTFRLGLQKVLAGEVNDWIPDLMPDIDEYLAAIGQAAFAGIAYCRDYAAKAGRPVWGFKYPAWNPATIRLLRTVMPGSRFIFIHRDVVACLKSAKAQQAVNSLQEVQEFCQAWVNNLTYIFGLADDPAILVVGYEELSAEPERCLERIAEFSGAHDMNSAVLARKINTWTGQDYIAQAKDGYTLPVDLTEAELQIVNQTTARFGASRHAEAAA